jgi:hypothetical protein
VLTHVSSCLLSLQHSFVKLDTTSQQDMLRVVMQLRSSTLAGHPVHARVKSSTTAPVDKLPWTSQSGARPFEPFEALTLAEASLPKKKKTRSRGKRKKKTVSADGTELVKATPVESVAEHSAMLPVQSSLSLGEDEFPTLLDNHVEWETPLEEQEEDVNDVEEESASKSASTATTTSTSSSSLDKQRTKVGYAAALRKAVVNPDVAVVAPSSSSKMNAVSKEFVMPPTGKRKEEPSIIHPVAPAVLPVAKPAQWGGTRSFVDVLRISK